MTNFNFFNYCSSLFGSWNKDLTYDCRLTVGSPSGRYCSSLLKLITVLVLILTLGVGNVWADYTVTFKTVNTEETTVPGITKANIINSGGDYVNTINATRIYRSTSENGLKFGSNSYSGHVLLTMTNSGSYIGQIQASAIKFNSAKKTNGDLKYTIIYTDTEETTGTQSLTTTAANYTIKLDSTKTVKYIRIENTDKKKQFYVKGFTVLEGYTLSYNCGGASSGCPTSISHTRYIPNPLPDAPTKDGYTFVGWYTNSGKTIEAVAGAAINANTTLYAKWVEVPSCSNSISLSKGTETNGTINTISSSSFETCSATGSDRRVTVTITPDDCYDAPAALTYTGDGTATMQGSKTDNGDGTFSYVYEFAQNNNGSGTFGVTCTAKAAGKKVYFDAGPGSCITESLTESCAGSGVTLPNVTATGVCKGWTTFVGWRATAITDSTTTNAGTILTAGSNYVPSSDNETLYAVYSKTKGTPESWDLVSAANSVTAGTYVITWDNAYYLPSETAAGINPSVGSGITQSNSKLTNTVTTAMQWTFTGDNTNGFTISHVSGNNTYKLSATNAAQGISVTTGSTDRKWTASVDGTYGMLLHGDDGGSRYLAVYNSGSWRYYATGNNYTGTLRLYKKSGGSTTYYCSDPNCCTALGSINGSVSWIKPDTAEITWNNVAHADSTWTLRYKTHAASSWSNAWSAQVAGTSDKITIFSDGGTNNKLKARIGGLACNTDYDFRLVPKNVSGYCPDSLTMDNNGSGYNSGKWSITKGSETNGTFTIGASSSCNGSLIAIEATPSVGYEFTSWTITKASGGTVTPDAETASTTFTMPSDNVTVTANFSCVAPDHVTISGAWDRFGGETISLTATAYDGSDNEITTGITGYQWQKYYNSTWNDISDAGNISGTTTNNLVITSCTGDNSGSYQCIVTRGSTCTQTSNDLEVKVFTLECYTGETTVYNFTRVGDTQSGTVQVPMNTPNTGYTFKVHADNVYYGNNGTVNEDVTNWVGSTSEGNLTVNSGLGGTFTFTMDYSSGGNNTTEGIPEISVTYPRKTLYLTPGVWNKDGAKFAFYYFRDGGSTGWTDFITADDCGSSAIIPQWNGIKVDAVRLKDDCSSPNWGDKWGAQTSDITVSSNNSITITGWNEGDYTYGTYSVPTYTISYAKGSTTYTSGNAISGSKDSETKTCGVDFTLPNAAVFTTTGYTQTGWAIGDGGSQAYAFGGTYSTNAAQAFYPAWTANTHSLSWSANGGDELTGAYTSGTVAYGTAIIAPNTPTKTGYTFTGWHDGSGIVTPATTMPDNDLIYTAQWSLATYTVTLTTNGGTINAGNVTEYTYGTGATLPTDVTRDGYRFDGWFTDDGVWSDQVTVISTTDTGNKTYYAKWTKVHTVTWSVNDDTWSTGVVDGNTYVVDGSQVSALPTAPTKSDCDDSKVFVGWKALAIDGSSPSNPGGIFTTQAGSPAITKDTTFYAVFADVSGGDAITLTFPDDNSSNNGLTSGQYTSEWTAKAGTFSFTVNNFNNNNWLNSWTYIRCGRKDYASVAKITTDTDIDFRVDTVLITIDATNAGKLNSAKLQISSSSTFATSTEMDIDNSSTGTKKLIIASPATDKYYRIVYDCQSNSNGFVQISKVVYKQKIDTANYVTSCSSCDADATFTNTTPAVSDIDCTSATLTATGGLATLGAEGCNVTDYGFVIGTTDAPAPAIGGSGVTKYQVGTTNPTTGADFSYDATGLTKGTHYYIRAYATNRHGTAYSSTQNFWTKDVSSIAITTAPTKTNYIVGETFDATGMVVTATMASGATEDVTSDVTYSTDALTAGTNKDFAINYTLCETAVSTSQTINVYTLTVTEGTNQDYGTATGSANIVSITGLGEHKTYTLTVTSNNATAVDNGDNTWSIINPTGNVTVRVDYADAVQVKVYYKVDGVTVTGLTQDVYQSETTTLPTASELATAMAAQDMDIPDDSYPNFYGWSETEFAAQTADPTLVTGTPTISAEKEYYAVFTNLNKKSILPSDFATSYGSDGEKTIDGVKYYKSNVCSQSSKIQFRSTPGYLYTMDALEYIKKIEITGLDLVVNACSDNAGTVDGDAITPTGTAPYVYTFPASKSYAKITGKGGTDQVSRIDLYYASTTVEYMTQFCTRYNITGASTSGTAVIVNGNTGGTLRSSANSLCEGKSLTLSATVNAGYNFGGWKIVKTGVSPEADVTSTLLPGDNATSLTPSAFSMPAYGITVSATITEKELTGWTWKQELADASEIDIPATVQLYVGQQARFNLKAYEPADVIAGKKGYDASYTGADLAQDNKAGAYYVTRAKIAKESTTLTLTSTSNGEVQEVINIRIKELPLVHFVDLVHGETFADVVANVDASEKRTVYTTKATPTHADVANPGEDYNTCEQEHLHLVGWIESSWADENPGAEPGDITSAGAGIYYAAGANIDLATQNGKTFYAVWSKIE